jgi:photosystem II stability/assembly factor-like uncharacterized protein
MTTRTLLLVGTPKGAFVLESDASRAGWSVRGPLCEGWPIHDIIVEPKSGTLLAAGGSPWYGPAVFRSEDLGATWTHSSIGLTYGDVGEKGEGGEAVKTVWSLAAAPDGTIYAGVEPAGLFRSADGGITWSHVEGLRDHPTRPGWQPGNGGLILHTIIPHATDSDRLWIGISAVGVFETRDGGETWEPRNAGVRADFFPDPHPVTGQCVHKFAAAAGQPETFYQQNHCGVYRTDDGGEQWTEITAGLPGQFGFPLVTHPRDPDTAWVIPLNGDDQGRYMPDASAAVWRTHDRGASWIRAGEGLPQEHAYLSVLREAMARDTLDPVGVAFGTGTGQLWHSADGGVTWKLVTANLPAIWSVESAVLDG